MHLAYARASFLLLCISLPSPGGNCHLAFASVSFQPPCIPLPTAGGNLHATSAGAIFQPLCIPLPLPTAGGNWFNWHQALAGSCFQYLCISPPTAGSNLHKTVLELTRLALSAADFSHATCHSRDHAIALGRSRAIGKPYTRLHLVDLGKRDAVVDKGGRHGRTPTPMLPLAPPTLPLAPPRWLPAL